MLTTMRPASEKTAPWIRGAPGRGREAFDNEDLEAALTEGTRYGVSVYAADKPDGCFVICPASCGGCVGCRRVGGFAGRTARRRRAAKRDVSGIELASVA